MTAVVSAACVVMVHDSRRNQTVEEIEGGIARVGCSASKCQPR